MFIICFIMYRLISHAFNMDIIQPFKNSIFYLKEEKFGEVPSTYDLVFNIASGQNGSIGYNIMLALKKVNPFAYSKVLDEDLDLSKISNYDFFHTNIRTDFKNLLDQLDKNVLPTSQN